MAPTSMGGNRSTANASLYSRNNNNNNNNNSNTTATTTSTTNTKNILQNNNNNNSSNNNLPRFSSGSTESIFRHGAASSSTPHGSSAHPIEDLLYPGKLVADYWQWPVFFAILPPLLTLYYGGRVEEWSEGFMLLVMAFYLYGLIKRMLVHVRCLDLTSSPTPFFSSSISRSLSLYHSLSSPF